jgi:hypothetical protein
MLRAWTILAAATAAAFAHDGPAPPPDAPDFKGFIVDAQTGAAPLVPAVVHATWVMRDGKAVRRVVKEVDSVTGGRYFILEWQQVVDTKGWKLVPGQDPVVRIYAPGYRRLVVENARRTADKDWAWVGEAKPLALKPLPESELAAELLVWKRDIEGDIAATPASGREAAIREREKLILLFDRLCSRLAAAPPGLCYAGDTPVGRFVAQAKAERAGHLVIDGGDGKTRRLRIEATPASPATTTESK